MEELNRLLPRLKTAEEIKSRLKTLVGTEQILKLAREGTIPHYIFSDPLTGNSTFLFEASVIEKWLGECYLVENKGKWEKIVSEVKLRIVTNDMSMFVADPHEIPQELCSIKEIFQLPADGLVPPCVYFLCKDKKIVYIGQSMCLNKRIETHQKEKDFNSVFFIPVPVSQLLEIEGAMIKHFRPPLNLALMKEVTQIKERDIEIAKNYLMLH